MWLCLNFKLDLLKGNALAPTSVPNMQQLLPLVLGQEMDRIIAAVGGRPISTIFNGTTHLSGNCSEMPH